MRVLKPFILVAALIAVPAAQAEPICDAIKNAAKVGALDSHFAAFRREMPVSPEGFTCRINFKGRDGAYACSTPVEPGARVATTKALLETIRMCVAPTLIVETNPREANAVFMISSRPKTWVIVNGADDPTRIYMNVVVSSISSRPHSFASEGWSTSQVTTPIDSTSSSPPFDPGIEGPR